MDKCIFGVLISSIILGMLIGPIFFFSDYGGFIAPNPVQSGKIDVQFIIDKTTSIHDILANEASRGGSQDFAHEEHDHSDDSEDWIEEHMSKELHSEVPYKIYQDDYPFFRQYDEAFYGQT